VIEKDKIHLPLLVVLNVILTSPVFYLISLVDLSKGKLTRQVLSLSFRFVLLKIITAYRS